MGHSGAARAGMLNFTETAAFEWAPVRVNAVAPGWIASSGLDHYPPEMAAHICVRCTAHVPLGRLGTESEVSAAICFLLSPAAAFISGVVPASRWRGAEREAPPDAAAGEARRAVRRLSSRAENRRCSSNAGDRIEAGHRVGGLPAQSRSHARADRAAARARSPHARRIGEGQGRCSTSAASSCRASASRGCSIRARRGSSSPRWRGSASTIPIRRSRFPAAA